MTSDAMTSDAMTSDAMTSDAMTSDAMTSDAMISDPELLALRINAAPDFERGLASHIGSVESTAFANDRRIDRRGIAVLTLRLSDWNPR